MKELLIPKRTENTIDCSAIDKDFKGIIICYLNNKPSGFIHYNDYCFLYSTYIDTDCSSELECSLLSSIEIILERKYADSFKVIEFD